MANRWTSTNYPGVRYRDHKTRRHGVQKDKYFSIYYRLNSKRREEGLGWASEGWSAKKASILLAKLKEAQKTGSGPQTLADSRRQERERIAAEAASRESAKRRGITFGEVFQNSYLPDAKLNKKPTSWKTESYLVTNWLNPVIGFLPLKEINPFHLERIKKNMADAGRAPRTIQYALATIRQVFNFARQRDLFFGDNPVTKVKMPKVDNARIRFLTRGEADQLLKAIEAKSTRLHELALMSLQCGLRSGEIFALKWADIDFNRGFISVLDSKGLNRTVPMTRGIRKLLMLKEEGGPSDLVFPNRFGNPSVWMSKTFFKIVDELGFNTGITDRRQRVTFHTLRHTYASWLVESGVDLYTVKNLLGHATMKMTERYSHLGNDTLQAAVEVLDRSLGNGRGERMTVGADNKTIEA